MVDAFTLQYYYEGFYVAYRPTPQGPGADRRAQLRAQQVAQHMDAAMKAFEAGRYEEAIAHTENASAVDEEDPRPHDLRTRAEGALADQHAQAFLAEAQAALQRGDIDGADSFVGRAIDVPSWYRRSYTAPEITIGKT